MLTPGKNYIGTELRLRIEFVDDNGAYVDPTTVAFETISPRAARVEYEFGTDSEIQKVSTGIYTADVTPDAAGRWHYRWATTGTGTAAAKEGDFLVQDSAFFDTWPSDYPL